jgi:acetyltransferase-like isoleucine patch superfamily enzyme
MENGATLQEEPPKPWIVIRDNVTIGPYCQLRGPGRITIGRNSKIGAHVIITTDSDSTNKGQEVKSDSQVYISDNVEIRNSCSIGAGVRIGPSTIVAPGSVLYRPLAEP